MKNDDKYNLASFRVGDTRLLPMFDEDTAKFMRSRICSSMTKRRMRTHSKILQIEDKWYLEITRTA